MNKDRQRALEVKQNVRSGHQATAERRDDDDDAAVAAGGGRAIDENMEVGTMASFQTDMLNG